VARWFGSSQKLELCRRTEAVLAGSSRVPKMDIDHAFFLVARVLERNGTDRCENLMRQKLT
jgi:hypothetical protein